MIPGFIVFIAGAAGMGATLGWIAYDRIKAKSRLKAARSAKKRREYVIPPTNEMYEGIREVNKS